MQYFQGKINQQAFNDMLIGEQSKILSARAKASEKADERKRLIKAKLSPSGIAKWLGSGPVRAIRRVFRVYDRARGRKPGAKKPKAAKESGESREDKNEEGKDNSG